MRLLFDHHVTTGQLSEYRKQLKKLVSESQYGALVLLTKSGDKAPLNNKDWHPKTWFTLNMSENIQISEGLQFYFDNNQNQGAVDEMLSQKDVPSDLTWEEIERFNDAKLSALSVQLDYWKLLYHIWNRTWGAAIDLSRYQPVAPIFYANRKGNENSVEWVWDCYFYKAFEFKNHRLYTICYADTENGIQIGFFVEDENSEYAISNQLVLSESWLEAEDDTRWTKNKLVQIAGQSSVNIDLLIGLANEAASALSQKI